MTLVALLLMAGYFSFKPIKYSGASQQTPYEQRQGGLSTTDKQPAYNQQEIATKQAPCWYASPEWVLAIVGILTFITIGWQSFETRRSANATKDAATAARNNIAILIGKERARLYVDSALELVDMETRREPPPRKVDCIVYKVGCHGGTSASILGGYTSVYLTKTPEVATGLTPLNIPMSLPKVIPPSTTQVFEMSEIIDSEIEDAMTDKSGGNDQYVASFLHFEAFIKYVDVFQTETQWELTYRHIWRLSYRYKLPPPKDFFTFADIRETTEEKDTKRESPN